jgi:radical SAM superfamily enzyme YgiQ (UPF0313 family)
MYLSSAIKSFGHETDIVLTTEDPDAKFQKFNPDVVAYSIMTGDQDVYDSINQKLKSKYKFFSIAGGPHPTFFPEMLKQSSLDAICIGEGEESIQQFSKNPTSKEIPNFWFKTDSEIIKNPPKSLIENLDTISFPDRELVFAYSEIKSGPIKHFIASRGCPFNCSYCFNESWAQIYEGKGKRVRFRSVDNLLGEISKVVSSSPIKFVYFQDDTFTLNRQWLKEFAEKYTSEINLPFHCHVRANTLDKEKVVSLEKAGCYSAHIAAETADDRLRNEILNRKMNLKEILTASELLREAGIKSMLQNIIGLPTGSLENDLETLELNIQCKPDYAWVSIFQPYPGTKLGEFCKKEGFYTGDFNDIGNNFFDSSRLNFSQEYKNQLSNLQKLFAVAVEHPDLYKSGLLRSLIDLPSEHAKVIFNKFYKDFRKKGDKRLYGFDL